MRLPVVTPGQKRVEEARQFSERLYQAFKDGKRLQVRVDADDYVRQRLALSSNVRNFWNQRGFRLRTSVHQDRSLVTVWLEQGHGPKRPKKGLADRSSAWAQRDDYAYMGTW